LSIFRGGSGCFLVAASRPESAICCTVFSSSGPVGSAGRITSTLTSSRQIQLGWRIVF
jgi:hypothetical protein